MSICLFCLCWLPAPPTPLLFPTSPPRLIFWAHVNYFVSPHISFNCCGFVYPGDQIELGGIVGDCQHGSVRKTDESRSNGLTTGATVRHADSITGLMDVWMM